MTTKKIALKRCKKLIKLAVWSMLIIISSCGKNKEVCDETGVFVAPFYKTPECEIIEGNKESKDCALSEMLSVLYGNLEYPSDAFDNKIEGDVVVQFKIDKSGTPIEHEITMSVGYGCDKEAIRVLQMFRFSPAKNECGDIIVSTMSLYVRFRL